MKTRRLYTQTFKLEAVQWVLEQGYSIKKASETLGISSSALGDWVKRVKQEQQGQTPTRGKALTAEQQRIQNLEATITRLEREKQILKKATTLLISDSIKSSR